MAGLCFCSATVNPPGGYAHYHAPGEECPKLAVGPEGAAPRPGHGWWPDPEVPGMDRWWNGTSWVDMRRARRCPGG